MSISQLQLNIELEVPINAIRQEKEIIGMYIRKEEIKLSFFAVEIIVFTENSKESSKLTY